MKRTVETKALRLVTLTICLLVAVALRADRLPPGMGKYILVVRTPAFDRNAGAPTRKYEVPDVAALGGRVVRTIDNWRVIELPLTAARQLRSNPNVATLQRVWTGESFAGWNDLEGSDLRSGPTVATDALDTNLEWGPKTYAYDGLGNIKTISADQFTYDGVNRLKTASVGGTSQTYDYDSFGNLTKVTTGGAVTTIDVDPVSNRVANGTYDAAGNLLVQPWRIDNRQTTLTYDSISMAVDVDNDFVGKRMIYTADDERIAVQNDTNAFLWTVRDFAGRPLRQFRGGLQYEWLWEEDWIYAAGELVGAERGGQLPPSDGTRIHFHRDHLGTTRLVTNDARTAIGVHDYYPFGVEKTVSIQEELNFAARVPALPEAMKFTGHERDFNGTLNVENTDYLDYMHARYYSANVGRFLSVDPAIDTQRALTEPQRWNRYAYVANNPVTCVDPDGKQSLSGAEWAMARRTLTANEYAENTQAYGKGALVGAALGFVALNAPSIYRTAVSLFLGNPDRTLQVVEMLGPPGPASAPIALEAKTGQKLGQQIARWRAETGATGGMNEFIAAANGLATRARDAGNVVTGTVGSGPQALKNATIYREGNTYLVVQGNRIMSYVTNAKPGGIVEEFVKLGGKL